MKATAFLVFAAMLVARALLPASAHAATAIYYSAPENAYGWCAGYASSKARSCAKKNCEDQDGSDCQLALECDNGGWGAVALAERPARGVGMTCGLTTALAARTAAMVHCAVAANTLCWTDYAFDGRGKALSSDANAAFDSIWYAQALLQVRGLPVDSSIGEMNKSTRDAIGTFQKLLGRKATGKVDDELVERLLDAVGGRQNFVRIIKRDVIDKQRTDISDFVHAEASTSMPAMDFTVEVGNWDEDRQRLAMATMLSASGTQCTLPAEEATALAGDASSGQWDVTCAEGRFQLFMSPDGSRLITGG